MQIQIPRQEIVAADQLLRFGPLHNQLGLIDDIGGIIGIGVIILPGHTEGAVVRLGGRLAGVLRLVLAAGFHHGRKLVIPVGFLLPFQEIAA